MNKLDSSWCGNLDFDKTRNLGGYVIKIGTSSSRKLHLPYDETRHGVDRYRGVDGEIARMLWINHLNARIDIITYPYICFEENNNKTCKMLRDLTTGKVDYIMNPIFQRDFWKQQTYPFSDSGLCLAAPVIEVSLSEKFLLVFPLEFWLVILTFGFLSVVSLKYLLKQNIISSGLEVLRMILGTSSIHSPRNSFRNVCFIALVFITFTLNVYFQSRMSYMFTTINEHMLIETLDDLENSHFDVHGHKNFKQFFHDSVLFDRYRYSDHRICLKSLEQGEQISCVMPCSLKYKAKENNSFHLAKNMMKELFVGYMVREDWPLLPRFDELLRWMDESGFLPLFYQRQNWYFERGSRKFEGTSELSVKQMKIALFIFVGGSILALNIFMMEIVVSHFFLRPRIQFFYFRRLFVSIWASSKK